MAQYIQGQNANNISEAGTGLRQERAPNGCVYGARLEGVQNRAITLSFGAFGLTPFVFMTPFVSFASESIVKG